MSAAGQIDLLRPHRNPYSSWRPEGRSYFFVTRSLPFYRSQRGCYVHRIRSGIVHVLDGKPTHTSLHLWCGMTGFLDPDRIRRRGGRDGEVMAEPAEHDVVCATCEGRAIGSGLIGSPQIAGRMVKFSPHR